MATERDSKQVADLLVDLADTASDAFGSLIASMSAEGLRGVGERPGQYAFDLTVDRAVLDAVDHAAGARGIELGVLSEESGLTDAHRELMLVVDPVDGSTNASRELPWFACSLCVLDGEGPWVSLVRNLATRTTWQAVRGGGATRDGGAISVAATAEMADAFVVLNGHTPVHFGWRQYRALGATALDICAVADGSADATIDCTVDALGPWDYLGAMLVLTEAGGAISDASGRELVVRDHTARRTPVTACTPELLAQAIRARESL